MTDENLQVGFISFSVELDTPKVRRFLRYYGFKLISDGINAPDDRRVYSVKGSSENFSRMIKNGKKHGYHIWRNDRFERERRPWRGRKRRKHGWRYR